MTMPKTAAAVAEFGFARPAQLDDERLAMLQVCLDSDLPGAMDFIDRAAARVAHTGTFAYLSQSPADMASRADWNTLVGYLARLFASPFRAIAAELMQRRYGVAIAFVNCCIVAAWPGEVDEDELWCLQSRMQLTPDC
jgi:hypothetical protein